MTDLAARLTWASGLAVLSVAAIATAVAHGSASRRPYPPPDGQPREIVKEVRSAAEAYELWRASGTRGRRLVVLTGQWSKPARSEAGGLQDAGVAGLPEKVAPNDAIFAATRAGIVRRLDVVMPPAALSNRLGAVMGQKELVRQDGGFLLPFQGIERRFSTPRGFAAPDEPVLVLVEPSWFSDGADPDPIAWLRSVRVTWDLALLARIDSSAGAGEPGTDPEAGSAAARAATERTR